MGTQIGSRELKVELETVDFEIAIPNSNSKKLQVSISTTTSWTLHAQRYKRKPKSLTGDSRIYLRTPWMVRPRYITCDSKIKKKPPALKAKRKQDKGKLRTTETPKTRNPETQTPRKPETQENRKPEFQNSTKPEQPRAQELRKLDQKLQAETEKFDGRFTDLSSYALDGET